MQITSGPTPRADHKRNFDKHQIRALLIAIGILLLTTSPHAEIKIKFKRIPTQFIATPGDPDASTGTSAETRGLWQQDPGPRVVWLRLFPKLITTGGYGPGNWQLEENDWWLYENGLIMELPSFPIPPGKYLVTGEREVTTVLTVFPTGENGTQRWELADNASLFDGIDDLEAVWNAALATGGTLKPLANAWQIRSARVLDGSDPEGNVVQFKQQ